MKWYLLQTKPNGHFTASEHLKRQGFDVFLPLITKTTKKNGKFVNKTTPLFSGYLFLGTSNDIVPWKSVKATRGISNVVTLDSIYRPISIYLIESLKYRCDEQGFIQRLSDIEPGDIVKIERGPFAEFICTVDEIKDGQRAWVLIDLLKQQTRAEVYLDDVSITN